LEKDTAKIISDLEERLKFYSQLGVEFITSASSSAKDDYLSLVKKILNCRKCELFRHRKNPVPGEGNLQAELMFVGEAPGRDEDLQGKPFIGRAGQLLTKIIKAMKYRRQDVYITNVVKCRPPNNRNPHQTEIEKCQEYLLTQIELIKPQVIVSLGKVATDFFLQSSLSMTALRGKFYDYGKIRIMPTFHPSYLVRNEGNRRLKRMVWEDMKKVMAYLGKK